MGIIPSNDYKEKVLAFQKKWSENRLPERIEPHITVKAPFDPPKDEKWIKAVEEVCRITPAFSVSLGIPSFFGERVVFLSVKSEGLYQFHQKVIAAFTEATGYRLSHSEGKSFTSHLTLGNIRHGLTPPQIREMAELAAEELSPFPVFDVQFLRVFQKENQWTPWQTMLDLPFANRAGK